MSDRERMIEVIESFANGVDFIEVIQCGALADRLIKAGFGLVNIRFSNESEVSEEGTIKLDQS